MRYEVYDSGHFLVPHTLYLVPFSIYLLKLGIIQMQRFSAVSVKNYFHCPLPCHLFNHAAPEKRMLHGLALGNGRGIFKLAMVKSDRGPGQASAPPAGTPGK